MKIKLVIIVLLLLLCGCSSSAPKPQIDNGLYAYIIFHTDSFDTYSDYINTLKDNNGLPVNFVHYNHIKELGTFHSAHYTSNGDSFSYISYELTDENAYTIRLDISFIQDLTFPNEALRSYSDTYGVRRLSTNESGYLVRNQIVYHYIDGYLSSIYFSASGRWCTLELLKDGKLVNLSEYPTDGANTFTAKLLSRNPKDAQAAVDALCRNIPPTIELICIWLIVGLLIAAAGVSTFLLLRRKKKGTIPPTKVSDDYTEEIIYEN